MSDHRRVRAARALNGTLAIFAGVTALAAAVVIWEIFKGWRTANGLP